MAESNQQANVATTDNQAQVDKNREFLILQFNALREEILAIKERVIRMQTVAISGIPLIVSAGNKLNLDIVIIVSPIITIIAVLMISFEQSSIMRAGRYIRKHIEPNLKSNNITGWEEFLQKPGEHNRNAEKYFSLSVIIAFALYYLGGVLLAFMKFKYSYSYDHEQYTYGRYKDVMAVASAIIYIMIFPFCIFFVAKSFKTGTGNDM